MVTYLVVDVWDLLNPWRTLATLVPTTPRSPPSRAGAWPSVAGLLALVWLEVVTPVAESPRTLGTVVVAYTVVTVAGGAVYGDAWFRRVDPVARVFERYGRLAPIQRTDDGLTLSVPGTALARDPAVVTGDDAAFMYAITDRETVQNLLEDLTGQRLMFNYFRVGGVAWNLPEPRADFLEDVRSFVDGLPRKLQEYHDLLTANELFQMRTVDTGVLPPETAKPYGCTGPVARGSGIDYDVRRDDPWGHYDELDWDVVTADACDNYARVSVRLGEIEQSARIVAQCVDLLDAWSEGERTVQANVPRTLKPTGECYRTVEAAKGELGVYVRADGTETPARFRIRGPSFSNLSALPAMAEGEYVADLIATLGSLDTIMSEVDR
jgi:hypothetical protein